MDEGLVAKTLAIVLYGGILLVIGALASRRMKDLRDYFAAGKRLGYWSVAFSARATGESAWLLLGLTGMGAYVGVKAFWVVIGEVLGVGLSWLWMARPFKRLTDHHDAITIPDYLEGRLADHGQGLRRIAAAALVVFVSIFVSAQIDATGQAFEQFLGAFRAAVTPQDQLRNLYALADFPSAELVQRACELAMSGEVRSQNAPFLLNRCIANRDHGEQVDAARRECAVRGRPAPSGHQQSCSAAVLRAGGSGAAAFPARAPQG